MNKSSEGQTGLNWRASQQASQPVEILTGSHFPDSFNKRMNNLCYACEILTTKDQAIRTQKILQMRPIGFDRWE